MRKKTSYFMGKLTLMHKPVSMDWIRFKFLEFETVENRDHWKIYYQYNSLEDVVRKMQTGEVISGFMIEGSEYVAYGNNCCGGEMHVIGIQRVNKGRGHTVLGMAYVNCVHDPGTKHLRTRGYTTS
jgi:hypothetical protein